MRGSVHARRVRDAARVAAGRDGERREHLGGRGHLGIFARVGRADVDQRVELAVGRAPQPELVRVHRAAPHAGLADWSSVSVRVAPVGERQRHFADIVRHGLALDHQIAPAHDQPQRLFLEIGLLHQPVRQPPQQVEMRPAALVAARPQPDVIGQQQRDAAFALAREQQQRLVFRRPASRRALGGARVDQAEPAAPVRRIAVRAFEPARHRMAFAELGQSARGTAFRWCGRSARPAARRRAACARCWSGWRSPDPAATSTAPPSRT